MEVAISVVKVIITILMLVLLIRHFILFVYSTAMHFNLFYNSKLARFMRYIGFPEEPLGHYPFCYPVATIIEVVFLSLIW